MSVSRYVNLSFVVVGLVAYLVLSELFGAVIEIFGTGANMALIGHGFRLSDLVGMLAAIGLAVGLRRSSRVSTFALEVGNELSKVTWPTWKETKLSTIVVVITTLVIAAILGGLDLIWGWLTGIVYGA